MRSEHFDSSLPPKLQSKLDNELHEEEVVLWTGQPSVNRSVRQAMGQGLGGIFVLVFCSFMAHGIFEIGRYATGITSLLFIPGGVAILVFILIGLALCYSPIYAYFDSKSSLYAVTNYRAIVSSGKLFESYFSYNIDHVSVKELPRGAGDIMFHTTKRSYYDHRRQREWATREGFVGIANPRGVESLINRIIPTEPPPDDNPPPPQEARISFKK